MSLFAWYFIMKISIYNVSYQIKIQRKIIHRVLPVGNFTRNVTIRSILSWIFIVMVFFFKAIHCYSSGLSIKVQKFPFGGVNKLYSYYSCSIGRWKVHEL